MFNPSESHDFHRSLDPASQLESEPPDTISQKDPLNIYHQENQFRIKSFSLEMNIHRSLQAVNTVNNVIEIVKLPVFDYDPKVGRYICKHIFDTDMVVFSCFNSFEG